MIDLGSVSGQWPVFSKSRKAIMGASAHSTCLLVKGQPRAAVLHDLLKRRGRFENRPYKTLERVR